MMRALKQIILGVSFSFMMFAGSGFAEESANIGNFVKARIEIGEMMMNYFSGGRSYGGGQRPSSESMREMRDDINAKVSSVLAKQGLTIDEYRERSPEIFADETAVNNYLNNRPDLKERYEALPLDRMGRGRSGRGY